MLEAFKVFFDFHEGVSVVFVAERMFFQQIEQLLLKHLRVVAAHSIHKGHFLLLNDIFVLVTKVGFNDVPG